LTKTMDELLLKLIGEVRLGSEEDHTALRDCGLRQLQFRMRLSDVSHTSNGKISQKDVRVVGVDQVVHDVDICVLAANDGCCIFKLELVESPSKFQRLPGVWLIVSALGRNRTDRSVGQEAGRHLIRLV